MKPNILFIFFAIITAQAICFGQQPANPPRQPRFIQITQEVSWPDGLGSEVGEVELVLEFTEAGYVIWHESGKRYSVPKTHAKEITSDAAALALIIQRQQLYSDLSQQENRKPSKPAMPLVEADNHWIKKIIERGQTVQLEDGTLWQINPLNKIDAVLWLPTERIVIVESGNPFYPYKLINSDGRSTAEAKLLGK